MKVNITVSLVRQCEIEVDMPKKKYLALQKDLESEDYKIRDAAREEFASFVDRDDYDYEEIERVDVMGECDF